MKILILEDDLNRIVKFKEKHINDTIEWSDQAKEVISKLESNEYDILYLDHDLGGKQMEWDEDNCGMTVAKYLNDNPLSDATKIIIHSFNFPAAQRMLQLLPNATYQPGCWSIK